ncbi:Uncharacterised protein [Pseudomonas putida]|nr:Uncharacterised protein [Pseudomonas putida]
MPGFDTGNVENIADQLKQANGRIVGGLQGLGVAAAAAAVFQGQLQQADHGIHRGTDFMAHGGQEGAFGLAGLFGVVLGLAQLFKQAAAKRQLRLQGMLGLGALVDQLAQVAVPEHHPGQQQGRQHQHLQGQRAVVAPRAVTDQGGGAPAVDQLVQLFGWNAQQRLVEDCLQLWLVRGHGEGGDGRVIVEHAGNAQAVLEHMADVVGGIDMAAQGDVGGTVGHGLHQAERVVHLDHPGLRIALLQHGPLRRTAYQGDAHAIQRHGLRR